MQQPEGKEVSKTASASGNDTPAPAASAARKISSTRDRIRQEITREQFKKNCFQETAIPYVTEDHLTNVVLERWKDIPDPRLRQIMQSLIKHLHGFVRDIEPTQAEWATGIDWLTRTGQMCSQKRQEFIMASDVLGVSMLVDAINHRQPGKATLHPIPRVASIVIDYIRYL
jgi:hypothetical protein